MIYCVVPEALESELYEKLRGYYENDVNVDVIVDRRTHERRKANAQQADEKPLRELRDRRRQRISGDFPPL